MMSQACESESEVKTWELLQSCFPKIFNRGSPSYIIGLLVFLNSSLPAPPSLILRIPEDFFLAEIHSILSMLMRINDTAAQAVDSAEAE